MRPMSEQDAAAGVSVDFCATVCRRLAKLHGDRLVGGGDTDLFFRYLAAAEAVWQCLVRPAPEPEQGGDHA